MEGRPDFYRIAPALREDKVNRGWLLDHFSRASDYITSLPGPLLADIEQNCPGYEKGLQTYIESLRCNQCVLLVAGEAGSGKSTLVNLLIGKELLPTGDFQCTATIVEVSYGDRSVKAYFQDERSGHAREPLFFRCDREENEEKFLEKVKTLVTEKDDRTEESPFKKIQIQWPLEMLQAGLTVVDTPGVGEFGPDLEKIFKYSQTATGIIYVLNSSPTVDNHKVGHLLYKTKEANGYFDHNTALFVCNHWDKVQPENTEAVKFSMTKKLGMILPESSKIRLHTLSAQQSAVYVNHGYYRPELQQLLENIRTFLPGAMTGKLRMYYRYLSSFLKKTQSLIRIRIKLYAEEEEESEKTCSRVDSRIRVLERRARILLEKLKVDVRSAGAHAWSLLVTYLDSPQQRSALTRWKEAECPKKDRSWQTVLRNANTVISQRLGRVISNWVKEERFVKTVEADIASHLRLELDLFGDRLREVEETLLPSSAKENDPQTSQAKEQKNRKISASNYSNIGEAVTSSFNLDPSDRHVEELFKHKYRSDPARVMEEATQMCIKLMAKRDNHDAIDSMFDRLIKNIELVSAMVPGMIRSDIILLETLNRDRTNCSRKQFELNKMEDSCSRIQGLMDMFYVECLLASDFSEDQIEYEDMIGAGECSQVYKGRLYLGDKEELVAVKESFDSLKVQNVTDVLVEESTLRSLKHVNIVKYFGMCIYRSDGILKLCFVMEYCPSTLKKKCVQSDQSPSILGRKPELQKAAVQNLVKYLRQICSGLAYLHQNFIVHRDLKPENILLNASDDVKIADMGLAKKVKDIIISNAGSLAYMAPEIFLLNDKQDTKVDVYSLAMIMWEMWYGKDLSLYVIEEIPGEIKDSIRYGWRPSLAIVHSPPPVWAEIMKQCWGLNPLQRPTVIEVSNRLERYSHDLQD